MENKKILHLLASNKFSGAENVVCTIIDNFKDEYDMVYCSPYGPIETTLKNRNIKYYGMKKFNLKCLKRIIKEYNPDIIHAHDYRASTLAAMSGFKGKIISHLHINAEFAKTWNLKSFLYYLSIKKFYKIIGVSDSVYNEAIFKSKIKNKYITIYNYVDKELILKKSEEYNYDKNYDLFFIGRLSTVKNPLMFIEIVKKAKENNNNITSVIIGDGELKNECIELIEKNNLKSNIEMLGFITNPFPIIKNCKIGIMPSKVEGFGLTAIESLILGKPVLNSGVGGLGEIFKNDNEMICNTIGDYTLKLTKLLNENCEKAMIYLNKNIDMRFCNKNNWKKMINIVYK